MRKSQNQRIVDAEKTLSDYRDAGLFGTNAARFMEDMIWKMKRGKYPTKRQREWLDKICADGVPEPKGDAEYIAKIDAALATPGIDFADMLREFRGKLVRGYNLTEKQKKWCDSLIEKADTIKNGTYWRPDEKTTERIKLAVACSVCYSAIYWDTHPGSARALQKARLWLGGSVAIIDEYVVKKLFKAVSGKLKEVENPKFVPGSFAYWQNKPVMVLSGPVPRYNGISYDVLSDGEIKTTVYLTKRRV